MDSPEATNTARLTLASYKRKSTLGAGLGVKKITRAAAQVQRINVDGKTSSEADLISLCVEYHVHWEITL